MNGDGFSWNSTGTMCGLINKTGGVTVYDVARNFATSFEAPCSLKGIKTFYFSPLSTYLVAAERFESKTPTASNMSLWHVGGKSRIVEGRIRKIAGNSWPCMKWSDDETCCCRVIAPEDSPDPSVRESHIVQVLNSKTSKTDNIDIPGVHLVEMCPGKSSSKIAVFVSASRDGSRGPAVKIYDLTGGGVALATHDLEQGTDTCSLLWNSAGSRLLVRAGSEVDETGNSYYGTSRLFLASAEDGWASLVPISHDPPVQDVQWSPQGDLFCLISGQTPFRMQLFDLNGVQVHELAKARKNTVRFSTVKGRFLALGGFGNLAGELEFLDVNSRATFTSTRSECTVECEWSPNGRVFMTSSTHPRMRVDNCITLFRYTGEKICKLDFAELYAAKWRPMPKADFPDVPASPRAFTLASSQVEPVKKAYRPPARPSGDEKVGSVSSKRNVAPPPPPPPPAAPPAPAVPIKMPCPEQEWSYRDPLGKVHGPYTKSVMNSWNKAGYFKADLPVRAGSVLPFVELNLLFPPEIVGQAFESAMVVPQIWLNFGRTAQQQTNP